MPVSKFRKKKGTRRPIKQLNAEELRVQNALNAKDSKGNLPVRVLCPNLEQLFFTISPQFIDEFKFEISNGLFGKIIYRVDECEIKSVAELTGTQKIVLNENYNQYLWSFCYSMLVLFDKGIHEPRLNEVFSGHFFDCPQVSEAWEVFNAGLSLRHSYNRAVHFRLPNPELYRNLKYVKIANSIYLTALNFILLHEFAHQYYGHYSYYATGEESKKDELLADEYAIQKLSAHFDSKNGSTIKAGILLGTISLFFNSKKLSGGDTHPDLDSRLEVIVESLELKDIDNLWGIASMAINLWSNDFKNDLEIPSQGDTYRDIFYTTFADLKRFR